MIQNGEGWGGKQGSVLAWLAWPVEKFILHFKGIGSH